MLLICHWRGCVYDDICRTQCAFCWLCFINSMLSIWWLLMLFPTDFFITNFERVCPFCYVLKAIMIIMFSCTYDLNVHIVLTALTSFRSESHECTLVLYVLKCLSVKEWVSAFTSPTTHVGWEMSTAVKFQNIQINKPHVHPAVMTSTGLELTSKWNWIGNMQNHRGIQEKGMKIRTVITAHKYWNGSGLSIVKD